MVLITSRPEYDGVLLHTTQGQVISLVPLDDSDITSLVGELVGPDPSVATLASAIVERAAGNPFFAEEMVRELIQRGVLEGERGHYTCRGDVAEVSVPATVTAAIGARIDLLGDTARQALNVARMRLLGGTVVSVEAGSATLKDAINEAFRDWVTNADNTYYCFGTAAGPHPFPVMVRDFQRVIGMEARVQVQEQAGRLPDAVTACVGGGSNAIGVFHAFIDDPGVRLVGFEAAGDGVETGRHAATFAGGSPGAFQGSFSYLLQDEDGQTIESHSISAGLDYPGVGPEHAYLKDIGRAEYRPVTDTEAMDAFGLLCRTEGIIPAIESAHAVAGALKLGQELGPGPVIVVNLSGRGDKDVETAAKWFGLMDGETGEAS